MRLLNYSHPITPQQKMDIKNSIFFEPEIENIPVQIDMDISLMLQITMLLPRLEPHESVLVRLPGHPEVAAILLQLLLEKAALVTVVCMRSKKAAIGVDYVFKECLVFTGGKDY